MSNPSDDSRSGKRVTLPPIRDLFRDEFMHAPPPHDPQTTATFARLRMSDDINEASPTSSQPPTPGGSPSRMYRSVSEHLSPPRQSPILNPGTFPSNASPYPDIYQRGGPSPTSVPHSYLSGPRRANVLSRHGPSESPGLHPHSYLPSQPADELQNRRIGTPSNRRSYPAHAPGFYPNSREPVQHNDLSQMPRLPTPPNPARSAQAHSLDSPPALVQAVAPWVIATNLDVGQIYEDNERTPIARPFDTGPMARSTSHSIPLGRFLDDGSQPPLGKYECRFCGKLFNRPSSLRIHLNSHTGEKPFVCPHADCGRSFSVLSNMRRHARVHTNNSREQDQEESNDETSIQSSPTVPSTPGPSTVDQESAPVQDSPSSRTHYRRDSNASASSSSSK